MPASDHAQTPVLSKNRSRVCFACRAEEATHRFCYSCHCRDSQTKEVLALQICRKELEHFRTLPYSDNRIQDFIPNTCTGEKNYSEDQTDSRESTEVLAQFLYHQKVITPWDVALRYTPEYMRGRWHISLTRNSLQWLQFCKEKNTFVLHICYHI